MTLLDLAIFDSPSRSRRFAAHTLDATDVTFSTNSQGHERLSATLPLSLVDAFLLYDAPGTPWVVLFGAGLVVFEGRLEDAAIADGGLQLTALGGVRALTDLPYTALWSTTSYEDWRPATSADNGTRRAELARFDQENRIYIAPEEGVSYDNTFVIGQTFETPVTQTGQGGRSLVGISYDYQFIAPASWQFLLTSFDRAYTAQTIQITVNATGALISGTVHGVFSPAVDRIEFVLYYNAASATFAAETGSAYVKVTNLRLTTSIANRVSTTFTANRAAGSNVTATVGSTARMYVGQQLQINTGGTSETVTVISIGSSTQFNATFVNSYVIGNAVNAHVIYADEVAADLASKINATNSDQIRSSSALIQSPSRDLLGAVWYDTYAADVLGDLIERGDTSSPPKRWVYGVDDRRLFLRDPDNYGRVWYVDATSLEVQTSLDALFNDAYAVYDESNGEVLRSANNADAASVQRFGLTRRQAVGASTANSLEAAAKRDTAIRDGATPPGRASITFDAVYDASGARYPLWCVRAGDTFVLRNLPPNAATAIDRVRRFRLGRTEYDADGDVLSVEPEEPRETLEAQLVEGIRNNATTLERTQPK